MSEESLTFNQTVKGIAEFIEVAIHTILYVRQIYPADIFIRRKKYETPVWQSRHPALNEYIAGAVKAVREELALGKIDKVVVVIKNKEQVPMERFIFAARTMIEVETFNQDTSVEDAMVPETLGNYFRSFLIKLNLIESQLGLLPPNDEYSFAVVIELRENQAPTASETKDPPPWIPAEEQHTTAGVSDGAELHMVRAVDTGIINLSLAVQESEQKMKQVKEFHAKELPKNAEP